MVVVRGLAAEGRVLPPTIIAAMFADPRDPQGRRGTGEGQNYTCAFDRRTHRSRRDSESTEAGADDGSTSVSETHDPKMIQ